MEKIVTTTKEEALKAYGAIMQPIEAAIELGVKQPAINAFWDAGTLTHLIITRNGKKKSYCVASEVFNLRKKRIESGKLILPQ